MLEQNLYERWLKKQQAAEYFAKNGTTLSGIPVKILDLPNGWLGKIFGPYPRPKRADCETESEYRRGLRSHEAYQANLEYFWVIPYYVWSAKSIGGNDYQKIETECFEYARDQTNIYDPERSIVDGVWYDRPDIYDARLRYKARLDAKFMVDKKLYLSNQK